MSENKIPALLRETLQNELARGMLDGLTKEELYDIAHTALVTHYESLSEREFVQEAWDSGDATVLCVYEGNGGKFL